MSQPGQVAGRDTTLLVGTDKGLFIVRRRAAGWTIEGPELAGHAVMKVTVTPGRPRESHAAATHPVWGPHLYRSVDAGATWHSLDRAPHHPPRRHDTALRTVWDLAWTADGARLYAGIDPPGLFVSDDRGATWRDVASLNEHPTRCAWEPSRGIFAVHSICIGPAGTRRIVAAVSAGGAYRSDDDGESWEPANGGVRAENLPQRYPEAGHNVHRIVIHGATGRLYRQCYNGTYRSDDGGRRWSEITAGLPSDFGYALSCDPGDADRLFVVPESGADLRTTVDAKLRVYRSDDAGAHWASASAGLPQQDVYVTVLREAMDTDDGQPCGLYFGTSSGHLFASLDAGDRWELVAAYLPRILCVRALPAASA